MTQTPTPGTKEAGDLVRAQLAEMLLEALPLAESAKVLGELIAATKSPEASAYSAAARLAALRYANELNGVVTAAEEKAGQAVVELPEIIVAPPPGMDGSSAEGIAPERTRQPGGVRPGPYDATYPGKLPPEPEPETPGPMKGAVTVKDL
jgi:hypothetical protein